MARILGVGIATLDIVNVVPSYPAEDAEIRALGQRTVRGGNATNTLVVLSQLGHHCSWAGVLAEEPDAERIRADLAHYRIDDSACRRVASGKVPTSYITLSEATGSRTIVHYRDLPEYDFAAFAQIDMRPFAWLHFEGRNVEETRRMLAHARATAPHLPVSLEIEKPRPDIESLAPFADVVLLSRGYAHAHGLASADALLQAMRRHAPAADLIAAWGEEGSYGLTRAGAFHHAPAVPPPKIVDTLGAGDTFNAGIIDAYLRGLRLADALAAANRLAGEKCGRMGLELGGLG